MTSPTIPGLVFRNGAAITKSDSAVLDNPSLALYVGGAGTLHVVMLGGQDVTFSAVTAGSLLPIQVTQVKSTGTSATGIVALW